MDTLLIIGKVRPVSTVVCLCWICTSLNVVECAEVDPALEYRLVIDQKTASPLGELRFEFTIRNRGESSVNIVNPLLSPLVPIEVVRLLVFDDRGTHVGEIDLGQSLGGSKGPPISELYWVCVPPGSIIGCNRKVKFRIKSAEKRQLEPGFYTMRMAILDSMLSKYPFGGNTPNEMLDHDNNEYNRRIQKWKEECLGKEIYHSNSVLIAVVATK